MSKMVYCYRCGHDNPEDAIYCNSCAVSLKTDRRFEDDVKKFADEVAQFGMEVGKTAAELGKKVANEAMVFAEEVGRRVVPKTIDCPTCKARIYETDIYCYKCGGKRE